MDLDLQSINLLTRVLGELALISMIYGSICRLALPGLWQQAAHGLLFGGASVITMLFPISFADGVNIDGHLMMLAHSAAFGGPLTFVIGAAISLAYRTLASGAFLPSWLISTAMVGLLALGWNLFVRPRGKLSVWSLVALGVINSLQIVLFFLLPFDVAIAMIVRTLPVGLSIAILGAVLMGKFIERELRHIDIEARLAREAQTDALTGLSNRRAFERAIEKLDRAQASAATMVLDIDHFKKLNDAYGHHAGDAVLKDVASTIAAALGPNGTAFRTGGEEFTVVATSAEPSAAMGIAERIRLAVSRLEVPGIATPITISIGLAQIGPDASAMLAIRQADKALYAAKAGGRNRVIATPTVELADEPAHTMSAAA